MQLDGLSLSFMLLQWSLTQGRYLRNIYTDGCVAQARSFINSNLYVILGAGGGLLVFQLLSIVLSASLAVGVRKEKALARSLKKRYNQNMK